MTINYPRIQNRPIRFALAGCGRISNNHIEAIALHKNRAELVAVCDVDAEALNKTQIKTGVAAYTPVIGIFLQQSTDWREEQAHPIVLKKVGVTLANVGNNFG